MRKRFALVLVSLMALAAFAFGGAQLASAAPENPTLTGKRVWCGFYNGDTKALDAPCSSHADPTAPDKRSAWFVGPLPVPGAAGYADSIKAIVGSGGGVGPVGPQGPKDEPGKDATAGAVKFIAAKVAVPAGKVITAEIVQPAMSAVVAPGSDPQSGTDLVAVDPPKIPLSATLVNAATSRTFTLTGGKADHDVTIWLLVAQR